MKKVLKKKDDNITISLDYLLELISPDYKVSFDGNTINIIKEDYEKLFDRDLEKAKKASSSDFLNI